MYLQTHIAVEGASLYCEIAGTGPAVVLLHGFTLDTRMWDDQFLLLAQHFQVIRYDLRGFGQSTVPAGEPYSHVEDLHVLLRRLKLQKASLVGQSMGGAIALDFALAYPQSTQTLVLIDTVVGGYPWSAEASAREDLIWQCAREGGIPAAKQSWLTHPLFAPVQRNPQAAARLAQIIGEYSGWHFVHADPGRGPETPAINRLAELAMPLLVMVGEHDTPDFMGITEHVCRMAPRARKHVVAGAGHMANLEAPQEVTEAILAFLKEMR